MRPEVVHRFRMELAQTLPLLGSALALLLSLAQVLKSSASMEELRCILGDGPCDVTLQGLLARSGGDVAAAANAFFDGSVAPAAPNGSSNGAGEDVLATLFKSLEDTGRKLAGSALPPHPSVRAAAHRECSRAPQSATSNSTSRRGFAKR